VKSWPPPVDQYSRAPGTPVTLIAVLGPSVGRSAVSSLRATAGVSNWSTTDRPAAGGVVDPGAFGAARVRSSRAHRLTSLRVVDHQRVRLGACRWSARDGGVEAHQGLAAISRDDGTQSHRRQLESLVIVFGTSHGPRRRFGELLGWAL
jgi:hypothetical protein